jgi:hypothetical protein
MITLFRKLRYNLIEQNKTGKYLKYAIGEILLVMIGILLALQVNNWNEYRKDRIKEQTVLQQLKEEYESNLKQLESKINIRNILISSSRKMLSYMDNPENVNIDSIILNLSRGNYRPTFDPITNDLISSNKLSLIKDDRLRKLLSQWDTNVYQLNEEELFWVEFCVDYKLPYLVDKKLTRKVLYTSTAKNKKLYLLEDLEENPILFTDSKHNIDYQELLVDPKLEALLSTAIFSCSDANIISSTIKKNILEILELINTNLDD